MTRIGSSIPGDSVPGRSVPGSATPGVRTPGDQQQESVETNIDVTTTGTDEIGTISGSRIVADSVEVDGEAQGFDFQVELDGVELFDSDQSPDSTDPQTFDVDNAVVVTPSDKEVSSTVEVVDASTAEDATADVTLNVLVEDE